MRPNKVGWFLVVLFGVGGFVFWRTIPEIWIGQIWMAVAAFLALLYIWMTVRANRATKLATTGVRGRAQVLEMTQTGTYINNQPRVKMRLKIEAPGVTPFEVTDTVTVPLIALGSLQPGRPLTVVLDPADPQKYVIDWGGNSGGPPIAFSLQDGRSVNLAGDPAATAEVMAIFQKYGLNPAQGLDLRNQPQVRDEMMAALQRSGHLGPVPGSPAPPPPPVEDPSVRLTQLAALRDSGKITAAEFEEHKKRILTDI